MKCDGNLKNQINWNRKAEPRSIFVVVIVFLVLMISTNSLLKEIEIQIQNGDYSNTEDSLRNLSANIPHISSELQTDSAISDTSDVYFTLNFYERELDNNSNSKLDALVIDVEVNVSKEDKYYFTLDLISLTNSGYYRKEQTEYLTVGIHNVSMIINMHSLYYQRLNTSFIIDDLRVYRLQDDCFLCPVLKEQHSSYKNYCNPA